MKIKIEEGDPEKVKKYKKLTIRLALGTFILWGLAISLNFLGI